jgi:phosphatidylglycerol lysyltransferase
MTTNYSIDDVARQQSDARWPVRLVSAIVFVSGLIAVLEVLFIRLPNRFEAFLPLDSDLFGRFFGLFAGFLMVYFAGQLNLRKRLAWWIAFVASIALVLGHALFVRDTLGLVLPSVTLLLLALYREQFVVKAELRSVRQGLRLLLLCAVVALAYGSIGFTRLAPRDFARPHRASIVEGASRTIREFALVGNSDLSSHSRRAYWFLNSLDLLGGVSMAFAFYSLFRPLAYRYRTLPGERMRARELIGRYGTSSEDEFKLWPEDKAYFFGKDGQSTLAYRVDHGVALVLGEPIGPLEVWPALLAEFRIFCRLHDWAITLIYVPPAHIELFEAAGLRALKIGEDAVVDTATFAGDTIRSKHWRGLTNKFKRSEHSFEVLEAPQSPEVLAAALSVTKAWLSVGGRRERGYGLGYHDNAYLRRNRLYLVRDKEGRLVAFANGIISHNPDQETIDLMRYRPGGETGVMDFLLGQIILHLHADGVKEFGLGLAPLAGVGHGPDKTLEERVISLASRLGVGGFAYEGLRRFKNKFEPRWEPRYLVYERGPSGLTRTLLAINSLLGGG